LKGQQTTPSPFECIPEKDTLRYPGVYSIVDSMPRFPGGEVNLLDYLAKIKIPPVDASIVPPIKPNLINFIIDENGLVTELNVNQKKLDQLTPQEIEILRGFKELPAWIPGKCNGRAVPVMLTIPMRIHYSD